MGRRQNRSTRCVIDWILTNVCLGHRISIARESCAHGVGELSALVASHASKGLKVDDKLIKGGGLIRGGKEEPREPTQ